MSNDIIINSNRTRGRAWEYRGNQDSQTSYYRKKHNKGYSISNKHLKGNFKDIENSIFIVNKINTMNIYKKLLN